MSNKTLVQNNLNLIQQIKNILLEEKVQKCTTQEQVDFFLKGLSFFETKLKLADDQLSSAQTLTYIQNNLNSINQNLTIFLSNPSLAQNNNYINNITQQNNNYINNITQQICNTVGLVNQLPILLNVDEENRKILHSIIEDFREKINHEISTLSSQADKLKQSFILLEETNSKVEQNINNQKSQVEQVIIEYNKRFEEKKYELNTQVDEITNKLKEEGANLIQELEKKLKQASELVGIISAVTVANDYNKTAEHHRKQANWLRGIAIVFMIGLIIYLGIILKNISNNYDWRIFLMKIITSGLFIYPAQYIASQSNKHREQERFHKKMALDLAAIEPFIASFDEEKKKIIKEKLVDRYFNNNIQKLDSEIPPTTIETVVKTFAQKSENQHLKS
jgi:hypothetical protein